MQAEFFKANPFFNAEALKANPFFNPESFKTFAALTPAKMAEEFFKNARLYRFGAVDMDAMLASQRKTLDAVNAASRVFVEAAQKITARQVELVKETIDGMTGVMTEMAKAASLEDAAAKHAAFAKEVFETALENSREVAEMIAETNEAVAEPISARVVAMFDEVKEGALKMKDKPKAEKTEKAKAA